MSRSYPSRASPTPLVRRPLAAVALMVPLSPPWRRCPLPPQCACADSPAPAEGHGMVVAVSPPGADVGRDILQAGRQRRRCGRGHRLRPGRHLSGGRQHRRRRLHGRLSPAARPSRSSSTTARRPPPRPPRPCSPRTTAGTATSRSACRAPSAAWPWPTSASASCPGRTWSLPAVKLAEEGFVIDDALAGSLNWRRRQLAAIIPSCAASTGQGRRHGRLGGRRSPGAEGPGQDAAAASPSDGPDAFYKGAIADLIVAEMKAGGGLITKEDLAGYQAKVRTPIHGTYRGYDVYGPPPPSSGGICLVEMLNILENFDLQQAGPLVAGDAAPDDRGDAPGLLRPRPLPGRSATSSRFPTQPDDQGIRPQAGRRASI